jgi:hypothetical protein
MADKQTQIPAWKLSLAVWLPVVVLGVIYGLAYAVRSSQANNAQTLYSQHVQECQKHASKDNDAALARGDTSNGVEVCQIVDNGIAHGFLGLPVFEVSGIPDNSGSYP